MLPVVLCTMRGSCLEKTEIDARVPEVEEHINGKSEFINCIPGLAYTTLPCR